ncbi:MAG: cupin domain-containing protein [Actinomycetota bacterium]|nr:cupin domain-containing protein [Actinomycetota bacterium]
MNGDISYVEPDATEWIEFRPGSLWQILFEDPSTGQRAILVEWEPGYSMGAVDRHERDEVVFVLAGTFVQDGRASGPGTYIHHWAGSHHQASTPDGCKFLEIVTGHPERSGAVSEDQLAWFRSLVTCSPAGR